MRGEAFSWDLCVFFVCFIAYLRVVCRFCETYLESFRIDKKIVVLLFFALETGINFNGSVGASYFLSAVISHTLFAGVVLLAFSDHVMKKLFTAAVCIAAKTLAWNFGECFFSCAALAGTRWATKGQTLFLAPWLTGVIGGASYCLVIWVMHLLLRKFSSVYRHKTGSWYLMLSVLLFGIVAVVDVVNWGSSNGIMVVANGAVCQEVYYNRIFSHLGICLVTVLLMCIAGGFVFLMDRVSLEQRQKEEYSAQIGFYKMLNEQSLQMEKLRHDMKNHVLALYGMWEEREYEKAGDYLKKMMDGGNIGGSDELTGNRAVDALLYGKKRQAQVLGVRWDCNVQIPGDCRMDAFDLCVLLGNLLDNAIRAGSEMEDALYRFVEIRFLPVRQCLLLVVKNGTLMENVREMKRGIGMLNIDETIRKYEGTAERNVKNHIFEISVLFPGKQDDQNGQNGKQTV